MKNYREILRLKSLGYSNRSIASSLNTSRNTVSDVLEKAEKSRVAWPLDENVTNEVLDELFYGKHDSSPTPYAVINYEYIHRELSKKGITLTLLWQEYCEKAYANGETPYMSTQFGDKYRRWAMVTKATMRVTHKPGEVMQCRWHKASLCGWRDYSVLRLGYRRGIQGVSVCCSIAVQQLHLCGSLHGHEAGKLAAVPCSRL